VRTDGTETEWEFPSYGEALPHDLVHFAVEQGLGLNDGFWGLLDDGAEVVMVNDQSRLRELTQHWRRLPGEPITLTWYRCNSQSSTRGRRAA
jgi:hypothetical protein